MSSVRTQHESSGGDMELWEALLNYLRLTESMSRMTISDSWSPPLTNQDREDLSEYLGAVDSADSDQGLMSVTTADYSASRNSQETDFDNEGNSEGLGSVSEPVTVFSGIDTLPGGRADGIVSSASDNGLDESGGNELHQRDCQERLNQYDPRYEWDDNWTEQERDQRDWNERGESDPGLDRSDSHPCTVCWEPLEASADGKCVKLDCGEDYCVDCLDAAFEFSLRHESNFPLLCGCKLRLDIDEIRYCLTPELLDKYDDLAPEWTSVHRTYCAKCLKVLDAQPFRDQHRYSFCLNCEEWTCRECKASLRMHDGGCPQDSDRQKLLQLSNSMNWRQCNNCGNLIEKTRGCDHMTCICGHDFCYLCGHSPYYGHDCGDDVHSADLDEDFDDERPDWQQYILDDDGHPICEHTAFERFPIHGYYADACDDWLPDYLNECLNCEIRFCDYCVAARSFIPREQNVEYIADEPSEQDGSEQLYASSETTFGPIEQQSSVEDGCYQESDDMNEDPIGPIWHF